MTKETESARFHFDAVFYYVSDLERSIRFYRDSLGFKLVSRDDVARFDIEGVLFELVPAPDTKAVDGHGNARLCLRVPDAAQALNELRDKGVSIRPPESKSTGILGRFRDPDGNEICLWEYRS